MELFPLPADAHYGYKPGFRRGIHDGVDIFAPKGTPVLAVVSGLAKARIEPKGGNAIYLVASRGPYYYYGHLDTWEIKLTARAELEVKAGDVIGYVGNTGNAEGKEHHLHFQMRRYKHPLDPYAELRRVDPKHGGKKGEATSSFVPLIALLAAAYLWSRSS